MKTKEWALIALYCISLFASPVLAESESPIVTLSKRVKIRVGYTPLPLVLGGRGLTVKNVPGPGVTPASIPNEDNISIDLKEVAGRKIWLVKRNGKLTRLSDSTIDIESHGESIEIAGRSHPAKLSLSPRGSGADLIANLNIEEYLEGVLGNEMPPSWPLEALKAQAIAARTYTVFQMRARQDNSYQLDSTMADQVYSYQSNSPHIDKIRRAISETRGQILLTDEGTALHALYHSNCGGLTEEPRYVWGASYGISKNLKTVKDSFCRLNPKTNWTLNISQRDLINKLQVSGRHIDRVQIINHTPSERVEKIAFWMGEKTLILNGNEFRKLLGYDRIKSTMFSVSQNKDFIVFQGRGFGHGSGLCQWGARFLADGGASAQKILNHYYPGAKLSEVHVANN